MILDVKLKLHVKVKENGKMLKHWRFFFWCLNINLV